MAQPARTPGSGTDLAVSARETVLKLLAYCRARDWAGHDPYDALNSSLLNLVPALDSRVPRVILTQLLKRSPVDVRPLLRIPPTQNPKAMALFLRSALILDRLGILEGEDLAGVFLERLEALRSANTRYACWGYSFPWQTRTIIVPRGAPNLVCTTFIADALLDAYEQRGDRRLLDLASSAGEYILNDLYYDEGHDVASFSYPLPALKTKVHNANFLAAELLCRLSRLTGNPGLVGPALRVARYSASRQKSDGSWAYGELPVQDWVDNFHTGYNLSALRGIDESLGTSEFKEVVRLGFEFYRNHFFRDDGAARYFHDRTYPIDIHCTAQSLLTVVEFRDLCPEYPALLRRVYDWAMRNLWDPAGYFYYRRTRLVTIRTSYMRWSQAWMLLALATVAAAPAEPIAMREAATGTRQ